MQPTNEQVERSLAALRASLQGRGDPGPSVVPDGHASLAEDLARILARLPATRPERVDAARRRLESGEQPSADEVADRLVGRLVCDRLR